MSEHQADRLTILAIAIIFPLIGLAKLYFAHVIAHNVQIRTRLGTWIYRMFLAIGVTFVFVGLAYGLSYLALSEWIELQVWQRWPIRILSVLCGVYSLISTYMVLRFLLPLIDDRKEEMR